MIGYASGFAGKLEDYARFRAAHGFSGKHAACLLRFDAYCREFRPEAGELDESVVRGWFEHEVRSGAGILEHKAAAIRGLARHVGHGAYVLPSNMIPKRPPFVPYIMDDDELYRFFEAVDSFDNGLADPLIPVVMPVMLRLMYACGLRPGEARRLELGDVDPRTGEVLVRGSKRRKDRVIVASADLAGMISAYLPQRLAAAGGGAKGPLFVRADGSGVKETHLRRFVKDRWAAANPGVPPSELPNLRPYDLRHRFASEALQRWTDEGRDLYAMLPRLSAYMGHDQYKSTAYYIHILPDRLAKSPGVDWAAIDGVGLGAGLWED